MRHRGRTVSRAFRGISDNGLLLSLDRTPSWVTRTGSSRNWRVPPLMPFPSCFYAQQLSTLIKEKAWDIHRLKSTAVTIPPHPRTTMYVADVEHQPVVASRLPGAQECMIPMIPLLNECVYVSICTYIWYGPITHRAIVTIHDAVHPRASISHCSRTYSTWAQNFSAT